MSLTAEFETTIQFPRREVVRLPAPDMRVTQANVAGVPCLDRLRKAAAIVAGQVGGVVQSFYKDSHGAQHACLLGMSTSGFPNGFGAVVDPAGKLCFRWDDRSTGVSAAKELGGLIAREYVTLAFIETQSAMGRTIVDARRNDADGSVTVRIKL